MTRSGQLNEGCNVGAKRSLQALDPGNLPSQRPFPLEAACLFIGKAKMTSDTSHHVHFAAHRQLAKDFYHSYRILYAKAFDEVAWRNIYGALHDVPRLFQNFACKQVMDIAATNHFVSLRDDTTDKMCPCCLQEEETTEHILLCEEAGRVNAFLSTADALEHWLKDEEGTDPS